MEPKQKMTVDRMGMEDENQKKPESTSGRKIVKGINDCKRSEHWPLNLRNGHNDGGTRPKTRKCAVCGQEATKVCAACKNDYLPEEYMEWVKGTVYEEKCLGIAYCGRECQRTDWRRHRRSCKKVNITVRMMSGQEITLERFPIQTALREIAWNVSTWLHEMQSEEIKRQYHEGDMCIDLIYKGERQDNWDVTLDELEMREHEEMVVIGKLRQKPRFRVPLFPHHSLRA